VVIAYGAERRGKNNARAQWQGVKGTRITPFKCGRLLSRDQKIYEFNGCFHDGHTRQSFRDVTTKSGDTLAGRYERTMSRLEQITREGYQVKIEWECEFDESGIVRHKPELHNHPIIRHSQLRTRDVLYGGRTETMRLHFRANNNNETIQYVEVMSLYPYICKYFKFPVGHPVIHVGDAC